MPDILLLTTGDALLLVDGASNLLLSQSPEDPATAPWTLAFEVAFDVDPGTDPDVADWTDLSDRLRSAEPVSIVSGTGRLSGGAEGEANLLVDNLDRAVDPSNPSATYNLVPMRHARVTAAVEGVIYPLFRGFVDAWPTTWSAFDSVARVRLVDAFAWLGLQDADVDLPVQLSSARITALLDLAGWPAELRDIDTGIVEVEAFEQGSANLLRTLQDTADAEDGDLFVSADGKITFRSRHARFTTTPVATFGDLGIPFSDVVPAFDTAWLTNIGRAETDEGVVYEYVDEVSRDDYGPRVMPVRDLPLRAAEQEAVAQWEVVRFKDPHIWLDGLLVEGIETNALPTVVPLGIGDMVRVYHDPPAGGTFDLNVCVERVTHTIAGPVWNWSADLAPHFGTGPWLTLDDDVTDFGYLDEGNRLAP